MLGIWSLRPASDQKLQVPIPKSQATFNPKVEKNLLMTLRSLR